MPHVDAAFNLAAWLVRNPADAEDVMQDAMLRAYRFFPSCREDTARAWVLRIVRNACYDWLAAKRGHVVVGFADVDPLDTDGARFTADVFSGPAEDPESILLRENRRDLLNAMVAALPEEFREVLVLREMEELSYKEIADIVGIPQGTVMSRLSRARAMLMRDWKARDDHS